MEEFQKFNWITDQIIGSAINVHRNLGPGLLESTYEACLVYELVKRNMKIEQQKELPIVYDRVRLNCAYRIDILVENRVIVEVKAVESLTPVHEAQLLSYLKLSGCKIGLLINFNVKFLKQGLRRFVNNFPFSAVSAPSAVNSKEVKDAG